MSTDSFGKLYQQTQPIAVRIIIRKFKDPDLAEEAVVQAALYFMEHLDRYQEITRSLFIQKAVNQARDLLKARNRRAKHEFSKGGSAELVRVEEAINLEKSGHKLQKPGAP